MSAPTPQHGVDSTDTISLSVLTSSTGALAPAAAVAAILPLIVVVAVTGAARVCDSMWAQGGAVTTPGSCTCGWCGGG